MRGRSSHSTAGSMSQGGFILVSSLLISLMIAAVAMYFASVVRQRIRAAERVDDYVTASLKAWSAYEDMIYVLTTCYFTQTGIYLSVPSAGPFTTSARRLEDTRIFLNFFGEAFQWGDGVKVTLKDVSSLTPLIGGDQAFLRTLLLEHCGVDSGRANQILDGILDWQDRDDLKRLNGAEAWDYKMAGVKYVPRNSRLQTLDEMLLVRGMTKEIFAKLQPEMTYLGTGTIHLLNASPTLLRAVFPTDENFVRALIDLRMRGPIDDGALLEIAARLPGSEESTGLPNRVQIVVEARHGDATATIKSIYGKEETLRSPYQTYLWKK